MRGVERHRRVALSAVSRVVDLVRLPGRLRLEGWSVATEALHPHLAQPSDVVYRTHFGVRMRLDLGDYIQRCIYYETYEGRELAFLRRVLRPGDVVLDVGAHVGTFTLVAAAAVGSTGQVHAFEPLPSNYERLAENVALNGFDHVRVNRAAVGAAPGIATLGLAGPENDSPMNGGYTVGAARDQVTAPMVALDDYLAGGAARLVKIDAEGYEPEVFAGLADTLAGGRADILMLEVNAGLLAAHGKRIADVVQPLTGYRMCRIGPLGRLRPWSYTGEPIIRERPANVGFWRTLYMGVQDLGCLFNLVALRT